MPKSKKVATQKPKKKVVKKKPQHGEHVPEEKGRILVAGLSAVGCSQEAICFMFAQLLSIKITRKTLAKYYKEELLSGRDMIEAVISAKLLQKVNAGDMRAIEFFCSRVLGWKETKVIESPTALPPLNNIVLDKDGKIVDVA